MKKRRIGALLLAASMVVSLTACGSSPDTTAENKTDDSKVSSTAEEETPAGEQNFEGQELVVGVWGGSWKDGFEEACVKPFEEATGATIIMEEMGDNIVAQTLAQVKQDIDGIDIAAGIGNSDFCMYLGGQGAIMELDYSKIPNSEYIADGAKTAYGIGQYICADMFTYDNAEFPEIPVGAAGFWDTANYPGSRAIISFSAAGVLERALLADGVAYEDLYPLDVDRAFAKLDELKPSISKFWSSGSEIRQTISDKEAVVGSYWIAHANRAKTEDGADITLTYQDAAKFADSFGIVSNTDAEDLAYAFINFCLSAEAEAEFSLAVGYPPLNEQAVELLPEDLQELYAPLYLSYEEGGSFWVDQDYWAEHYEELNERYMEWIAD